MLGQWDEVVRRNDPLAGVVPADEGLGPHDLVVAEIDLRLVVEDELAQLDPLAQLAHETQLRRAVLVLVDAVDLELPVGFLGQVHRNVGALHEEVGVTTVARVHGQTDRCIDV